MPRVPVHKEFAYNAIIARLLLLGTGSVGPTTEGGMLIRLPGEDQVLFTHRHEILDRMQMLRPDDRPLSIELSSLDAQHVASLMNNVDISIRRARRDLPASFFLLADAVGRQITSGYILVRDALISLEKGELGGKFLSELLSVAPDLQQEVDRLRSDTALEALPKDAEKASVIHWYGWADRLERSMYALDQSHEVEGYTWRKVATNSGQMVLTQRMDGARLGAVHGDATIMLYSPSKELDVYYLDNAEGGLEMIANVDTNSGRSTVVGRHHWQTDEALFNTVHTALEEWISPPAPRP